MDQYVIDLDFAILYFEALELVDLIKNSGNELLLGYVESIEQQIKDQS